MKIIILLVLPLGGLLAQTLAFDAVSIKPGNTAGGRVSGPGGSLQFLAGRVTARNVTARRLIAAAYHLTPFQLGGGPAWIDSDRLDIDAKAETAANRDQLRQMLQTLLAERFVLTLKRGTKEMPVYALVVGKKGSKLQEWKAGEPVPTIAGSPGDTGLRGGDGTGARFFDRLSMQALADTMTTDPHIGRPVLDQTGLDGMYLINFLWDDDDSFMSAVEEATGLKFEAKKASLEFFTVEHVEKPSGN
jgi:uncharacterized protein (TIGR03435 family)